MVFKLPKREAMISSEIGKEVIKKELPLVPKLPGVYRMLNAKNEILYVGKAKNLPNRLKSYVSEKSHIIRTERMLSQTKKLFNYEKKILINELILNLKLVYYDFEKEKYQKVKFSLEIDYEDKKPTNDKDIKSIVNYSTVVKLIRKLVKKKHYNFLETLAEAVFDELFKDKRIAKIMLKIEKLEILKQCSSVGIQITKKRSHDKL